MYAIVNKVDNIVSHLLVNSSQVEVNEDPSAVDTSDPGTALSVGTAMVSSFEGDGVGSFPFINISKPNYRYEVPILTL